MGIDFSVWRARVRTLLGGPVQTARAEVHEAMARDGVERWQDYGFAANPVDGQGLLLEVGGHSFLLRVDRAPERPDLAAYEVTVWHREGHRVTLKAGGKIEAACTDLVATASGSARITSPSVTLEATTVHITGALTVDGVTTLGGGLAVTGAMTNNSVNVGSTHRHQFFDDDGHGNQNPDTTDPPH